MTLGKHGSSPESFARPLSRARRGSSLRKTVKDCPDFASKPGFSG
jgi:hypothetical protein